MQPKIETMKKSLQYFFFVIFLTGLSASRCKKEEIEYEPPRDRKEQYATEKDSILNFLQTHTYSVDNQWRFVLDTLTDPQTQTSLYDAAEVVQVKDPEVEDLVYDVYFISFRQGTELEVTTCDRVFAASRIMDFTGEVYFNTPELNAGWTQVWIPVLSNLKIYGLRKVFPFFKSGTYTSNPDGTVTFDNYGAGVAFIPSGLLGNYGYSTSTGVNGKLLKAYSPVIVDFKILHVDQDIDNDHVPNVVEDLNGDGDPTNDNTDKELEEKNNLPAYPNYIDPDDDGDHIRTKDEDPNGDGDPTNDDTDGDGIPNYLDHDTH